MNVQTERQPDHTARLTVQIDDATFEDARQKAARSLSKKVNIPGFRKGKVPLRVLINYVGEGSIIEEAVELLSQDLYRAALIESGVDPYGPGALVDIKAEAMPPTLIYSVPLQPTVDLGGYRALRLDFEDQAVTDEQVDRSMKALQEENAVVEASTHPAELGNRLTLALHSYFVDNSDSEDETADGHRHDHEEAEHDHDHDEADHEHDDDAIHQHMSNDQEVYLHEHAMNFTLDSKEDIAPGFTEALVGINSGETREFTLTFGDDEEEQELAGRSVRFIVTASKVENMTLPALNDEFAARVTKDEETPLSLLELRMRMRENLQNTIEGRYKSEYARKALDTLVEQASIAYPEPMVADHVDSLLQEFDQRLRRSGITLQDYKKINQKSDEDLYADWRNAGVNSVKRSLVLQGLVNAERLVVDEAKVEAELDRFADQFGSDNRDSLREAIAKDPSMRDSVRGSLLQDTVFERLLAIAKGEAPPIPEGVTFEMPAESAGLITTPSLSTEDEAVEPAASDLPDSSENEETP